MLNFTMGMMFFYFKQKLLFGLMSWKEIKITENERNCYKNHNMQQFVYEQPQDEISLLLV